MPKVRARTVHLSRWMLKEKHVGDPFTSYSLGRLEIGNMSDTEVDLSGYNIQVGDDAASALIFDPNDDRVIQPGGTTSCEATSAVLEHGQGMVSLVDPTGSVVHRLHLTIMTLPGREGFQSRIRREEFAPDAYEEPYAVAPQRPGPS